ncbi:MAG: hypothetical protein AUG51_06720 [Acidobacteria bacterium 13_1_20CM_3_53_8]|nr:MAG: hypothetical protein AUG51_06720 [Acidobacteria bacterium 13_1_20CM_3_53_8]
MTDEEMRKKMEFIVKQGAKFRADMQKLKERHAEAEARMRVSDESLTRIESVVARLEITTEGISAAATEKTEKSFASLDEKLAALAESQERTGRKLDALIKSIQEERRKKRSSNGF